LANGCICCTVADDFLPSMEALLDRDEKPDHILIETSGLALPKPLVKAFNWPEIRAQVTVDGVITVVDSKAVKEGRFADDEEAVQAMREADENLDHDNPLEEVFEDQLLCADMVVLNKADLLKQDDILQIEEELKKTLRDGVRFIHSSGAKVDPAILLGMNAAAEDDLDARKSHHDDHDDHEHDDFDSFSIDLADVDDADAFQDKIIEIVKNHDVLRVKGFLNRPGIERREVIQGVGPRFNRYFDRPWNADEARKTQLVIIGQHGIDRQAIEAALRG
ncbi:MAG: cobalamin biosynthesis protein CobW, partial [Alphaproteobacteria bacterium]|nr:cobalamin biosynthesis protein CobW [Alphaproteobacteria bacterium]